jgi:hypothetical protein
MDIFSVFKSIRTDNEFAVRTYVDVTVPGIDMPDIELAVVSITIDNHQLVTFMTVKFQCYQPYVYVKRIIQSSSIKNVYECLHGRQQQPDCTLYNFDKITTPFSNGYRAGGGGVVVDLFQRVMSRKLKADHSPPFTKKVQTVILNSTSSVFHVVVFIHVRMRNSSLSVVHFPMISDILFFFRTVIYVCTARKFLNVVLEEDGEDQLDRSCEK